MPAARFFFPPCENNLDVSQVPLAAAGIMVPGPGSISDPGILNNFWFNGRTVDIGDMYARVRQWTVTASGLQVANSGTIYAQGDLLLVLRAVKSGTTEEITDGPLPHLGEPDLCNHGGWYGEDTSQPNWEFLDEDENLVPGDPGPISLRFGERLAADGFSVDADGVHYCTVAGGRDVVGPSISFLGSFTTGLAFGTNGAAIAADVHGSWPATPQDVTKTFQLKLAGPAGDTGDLDLIGTVNFVPTLFWSYGGKFNTATGVRN